MLLQKGWLERESSFVHMSYKYLIGMFKSGLYDEFYKDIKTSMPPFMDPLVYGRSTLENVSFIATSNNPNPKVHGQGFVARLTGTTSEAITLMYLMFLGKHPFSYEDEVLSFKVKPMVTKDFFKNGLLSFKFLSKITIRIHNKLELDTFDLKVSHYTLSNDNENIEVKGTSIHGKLALDIRSLKFNCIDVYLG